MQILYPDHVQSQGKNGNRDTSVLLNIPNGL